MRHLVQGGILTVLVAAAAAHAQPFSIEQLKSHAVVPLAGQAVEAGENCAGGIIYDDGIFEDGIRFQSADARMVQRIDLTGPVRLDTLCVCWQALNSGDQAINFNIHVYDTTGPSGVPGNLISTIPATATGVPNSLAGRFYRYDLSAHDINLQGNAYVGVQVNGLQEPGIFLCEDEGLGAPRPAYASVNGGAFWGHIITLSGLFEAFGLRAEVGQPEDPDPPAGAWLTTPAIPAFQFKAVITAGANQITPTLESDCLAETLCLSGALPGRSELFARIIGPRPNGFLWVNLVRFTISQVEVWVQRRTGGEIQYYKLPAIPSDSDELSGLVDKQAFTP